MTLLRALSLGSPALAALANAAGGLVMPLLVPPLSTATHNLAKASPCPLRNKMAAEAGWDVGCFLVCLIAAELAQARAPTLLWVFLPLPATAASALALRRYFAART